MGLAGCCEGSSGRYEAGSLRPRPQTGRAREAGPAACGCVSSPAVTVSLEEGGGMGEGWPHKSGPSRSGAPTAGQRLRAKAGTENCDLRGTRGATCLLLSVLLSRGPSHSWQNTLGLHQPAQVASVPRHQRGLAQTVNLITTFLKGKGLSWLLRSYSGSRGY